MSHGTSLRTLRADAARAGDPDRPHPADDGLPADAGGPGRPDPVGARRPALAGGARRAPSTRAGFDRPILEQYFEYLGDVVHARPRHDAHRQPHGHVDHRRQRRRDARADHLRRSSSRWSSGIPLGLLAGPLPRRPGSTSAAGCSGSSSTPPRCSSSASWPSSRSRRRSAGYRPRAGRARSSSSSSSKTTHLYLIDSLIAGNWNAFWDVRRAPDPARGDPRACWSAAC